MRPPPLLTPTSLKCLLSVAYCVCVSLIRCLSLCLQFFKVSLRLSLFISTSPSHCLSFQSPPPPTHTPSSPSRILLYVAFCLSAFIYISVSISISVSVCLSVCLSFHLSSLYLTSLSLFPISFPCHSLPVSVGLPVSFPPTSSFCLCLFACTILSVPVSVLSLSLSVCLYNPLCSCLFFYPYPFSLSLFVCTTLSVPVSICLSFYPYPFSLCLCTTISVPVSVCLSFYPYPFSLSL